MQHGSSGDTGDKLKQNWQQFTSRVRQKWNDLTEDDLQEQRDRDRFVGRISERTRQDRTVVDRDLRPIERDTGWNWNR